MQVIILLMMERKSNIKCLFSNMLAIKMLCFFVISMIYHVSYVQNWLNKICTCNKIENLSAIFLVPQRSHDLGRRASQRKNPLWSHFMFVLKSILVKRILAQCFYEWFSTGRLIVLYHVVLLGTICKNHQKIYALLRICVSCQPTRLRFDRSLLEICIAYFVFLIVFIGFFVILEQIIVQDWKYDVAFRVVYQNMPCRDISSLCNVDNNPATRWVWDI